MQDVNESYKQNIFKKVESEIQSIKEDAIKIEKEKYDLSESLYSLRKQIESLEKSKSEMEIKKIKLVNINEKKNSLAELEKREKQTNFDIDMIQKHIASLDEDIAKFKGSIPLYEEKQSQLKQKQKEEKEQEIKIAELRKKFQ